MEVTGVWRIWFKSYYNGKYVGRGEAGVMTLKRSDAEREARRRYRDHAGHHYEWVVSTTDPWREEPTS